MKRPRLLFIKSLWALLLALHSVSAHSQNIPPVPSWTFETSKSSGTLTFDTIGRPGPLKLHGQGEPPKGDLKVVDGKLNGVITFKLDTLDTGINLRNKHLRERYLEVGKFPVATLSFAGLPVSEKISEIEFSQDAFVFSGILALHGVEKPIQGIAKLKREDILLSIEANFEIKTGDFGITQPSFAGVTVADEVKVRVRIIAPFHAD